MLARDVPNMLETELAHRGGGDASILLVRSTSLLSIFCSFFSTPLKSEFRPIRICDQAAALNTPFTLIYR